MISITTNKLTVNTVRFFLVKVINIVRYIKYRNIMIYFECCESEYCVYLTLLQKF